MESLRAVKRGRRETEERGAIKKRGQGSICDKWAKQRHTDGLRMNGLCDDVQCLSTVYDVRPDGRMEM